LLTNGDISNRCVQERQTFYLVRWAMYRLKLVSLTGINFTNSLLETLLNESVLRSFCLLTVCVCNSLLARLVEKEVAHSSIFSEIKTNSFSFSGGQISTNNFCVSKQMVSIYFNLNCFQMMRQFKIIPDKNWNLWVIINLKQFSYSFMKKLIELQHL